MANSETVGAIMAFTPALIRALVVTSGGSVASLTCTDALILGAATTSGVRLDLESGVLAVREGDDSAYAPLNCGLVKAGDGDAATLGYGFTGEAGIGVYRRTTGQLSFAVGSAEVLRATSSYVGVIGRPLVFGSLADVGIERSAAGVVKVTDGSSGGGKLELLEVTAPTGVANSVRIYAEDNGSGKTRLMAIFGSGAAQQIAIEP